MRTGKVIFVEWHTDTEPVEQPGGQIVCDDCGGLLRFEAAQLRDGLMCGPDLLDKRVTFIPTEGGIAKDVKAK